MKPKERAILIQEEHIGRPNGPWRVLVVCMLLNQTGYQQVDKVVDRFFDRYPDPQSLADLAEDDKELLELIAPIGFKLRRASRLVRMSRDFMTVADRYGDDYERYEPINFHGIGNYGDSAWKLFVLKKPCNPDDKQLKRYAYRMGLLEDEYYYE